MMTKDFGLVRLVTLADPFTNPYDYRVEVNRAGNWELYRGFNSLSDDYAAINAREALGRAIAMMAAESAANLPGVPA
jgi:hypothetical protein